MFTDIIKFLNYSQETSFTLRKGLRLGALVSLAPYLTNTSSIGNFNLYVFEDTLATFF